MDDQLTLLTVIVDTETAKFQWVLWKNDLIDLEYRKELTKGKSEIRDCLQTIPIGAFNIQWWKGHRQERITRAFIEVPFSHPTA